MDTARRQLAEKEGNEMVEAQSYSTLVISKTSLIIKPLTKSVLTG